MAVVTTVDIPSAKITEYLLNPDHPEGASKARFFLARGFSRDRPQELSDALARQAQLGWPGETLKVVSAVKHRIVGPILCPDGSAPEILTVWQAADDSDTAMLVTARPNRARGR